MRLQQESMYPKSVNTTELVGAVLAWEDKWKKMLRDQPDAKIPDMWKMSAMLKLCPKEIQDMVELRWDEISKFEVLKERVIGWANTKAERGGPVPMEVGWLEEEGGGDEEADWRGCEVCYDGGEIGAVYPTTKCYNCQGYGHMAKECPQKGKGKGDMMGGGKMGVEGGFKGYDKGGFKEYGAGGGIKGGFKGDGKGSGLKEMEKKADTKEHASIVEKSATRRRNAWSIWLGRWDSNARRKRRLVNLETKETHGWWQE